MFHKREVMIMPNVLRLRSRSCMFSSQSPHVIPADIRRGGGMAGITAAVGLFQNTHIPIESSDAHEISKPCQITRSMILLSSSTKTRSAVARITQSSVKIRTGTRIQLSWERTGLV